MTNEHDVQINRIAAALKALEINSNSELNKAAMEFLMREFAGIKTVEQGHVVEDGKGEAVPRCNRVRPSSRSPRIADATRCSRQLGHEGGCDFSDVLSQEQ